MVHFGEVLAEPVTFCSLGWIMYFQSDADAVDILLVCAHVDSLDASEGGIDCVHREKSISVAFHSGVLLKDLELEVLIDDFIIDKVDAEWYFLRPTFV